MNINSPDPSFVYLLPVPVQAGRTGSLGAVVYALSDQATASLKPELICEYLPERILPSPSYLFAQGLSPHRLRHGLKARSFTKRIKEIVSNRIIVTWDAALLPLIDVNAVRCFLQPLIPLSRGIISLRTLAHAAFFFGQLESGPLKALEKSAELYDVFAGQEIRSPERRLKELIGIGRMLREKHGALFDYQLRGRKNKLGVLEYSYLNSAPISLVNDEGECGIMRVLRKEAAGFTVLFISCKQVDKPRLLNLNEYGGEIIAPLSVFTKERCMRLGFDLQGALLTMSKYDPSSLLKAYEAVSHNDNPLYAFFSSMNNADRAFYEYSCHHEELSDETSDLSEAFKKRVFLYTGDHERGKLSSEQYRLYESLSRQSLQTRYDAYMHETKLLVNRADENDPAEAALIQAIAAYPESL